MEHLRATTDWTYGLVFAYETIALSVGMLVAS